MILKGSQKNWQDRNEKRKRELIKIQMKNLALKGVT